MQKLVNILVATDFSDRADRAVARAALMAQAHGATLHVVHVIDTLQLHRFTASFVPQPLATEQRLLESARAHVAQLASRLAQDFAIGVRSAVLMGRMHTELASYAASQAIDLSIFGAHGDNFFKDVFVGSVVSKYLRRGHQPTLVVRGEDPQPYQHILVAVDFSPASRLALEWAVRVAPQATIHVLHAAELPFEGKMRYASISEDEIAQYRNMVTQEAHSQLDAFLAGMQGAATLTHSVSYGPASRSIMAEAHKRQVDLVVLGKRGQFEIEEFLLGSVAQRVLEETEHDLLLIAPLEG